MKKIDCNICDKRDVALNDTIKIDGKIYCSSCFDTHFPDKSDLENKLVEKSNDTTICAFCEKDFGSIELKKLSSYPICQECEINIKNKTFPTWVKAFFIAILFIVVSAFIWNWKYYTAYKNINKSKAYFLNGDYSNATSLMKSASETLPEIADLNTIYNYFNGLQLLAEDKSAEALIAFEKCKSLVPEDYDIEPLILQAQIGVAYDNKDYDGFLEGTLQFLALDTTNASLYASVASAYACLYADKGFETDKENSLIYLQKGKNIDSTSADMKDYIARIEYRLESRNIITRAEYYKIFPNGWTKN